MAIVTVITFYYQNQERLWRYEKCALGSQKSLEDKIAERLASKQGRVLNRNSTFKALHSHQEGLYTLFIHVHT